MIPFLEHDDANRALMGSNMQRQAVPLITTDSPVVGTGMEVYAAKDSGELIVAKSAGTVVGVNVPISGHQLRLSPDRAQRTGQWPRHPLQARRQGTRSLVRRPQVRAQQPGHLPQSSGSWSARATTSRRAPCSPTARPPIDGELALGQNVLVAFMPWEGYNYEDAILISESVVREDKYTSIHIEEFEVEVRETKLGPEEITRDLPNVGEESLRNLDERGIVYVGAEVAPGDILVGKTTPKGESELSAEERLLRAIFGEKAQGGPRQLAAGTPRRARGGRGRQALQPLQQGRAPGRRQRADPDLRRPEAEDQPGRQDGRTPRQQGRDRPDPADRGHALPARRHPG